MGEIILIVVGLFILFNFLLGSILSALRRYNMYVDEKHRMNAYRAEIERQRKEREMK